MKLIITFACLLVGNLLHSQDIHTIDDPVLPFARGERSIRFQFENSGKAAFDFEVRVFYSSNRADLEVGNSQLANTNLSYARLQPFERENASPYFNCEFIIPHASHPAPNFFIIKDVLSDIETIGSPITNDQYVRTFCQKYRLPLQRTTIIHRDNKYSAAINTDNNNIVIRPKDCLYFKIWIKDSRNQRINVSKMHTVLIPPTYNIAIAGDSYASGEGAPDLFDIVGHNDVWLNTLCHRSGNSGLFLGADKLRKQNPRIALNIIHESACSGAKIEELYRDRQQVRSFTDEPQGRNAIQFETITDRLDAEPLNLLLLNIGGNNVGFADIIAKFGFNISWIEIGSDNNTNLAENLEAFDFIVNNINQLPERYRALDSAAKVQFPTAIIAITNLPDLTRDIYGEFCNGVVGALGGYGDCFGQLLVYNSVEEYSKLYELTELLNEKISDAAHEYFAWDLIDVHSNSRTHGFCNCDEPYFNRLFIQPSERTKYSAHPNTLGFKMIYEDAVYQYLAQTYDNYSRSFPFVSLLIPENYFNDILKCYQKESRTSVSKEKNKMTHRRGAEIDLSKIVDSNIIVIKTYPNIDQSLIELIRKEKWTSVERNEFILPVNKKLTPNGKLIIAKLLNDYSSYWRAGCFEQTSDCITWRYVFGSQPNSPKTAGYNEQLGRLFQSLRKYIIMHKIISTSENVK